MSHFHWHDIHYHDPREKSNSHFQNNVQQHTQSSKLNQAFTVLNEMRSANCQTKNRHTLKCAFLQKQSTLSINKCVELSMLKLPYSALISRS